MINNELKKAIIEWVFKNINEFQIYNECSKNFREYIFNKEGNYLIGGEEVYNFCHNAIDLITEKKPL